MKIHKSIRKIIPLFLVLFFLANMLGSFSVFAEEDDKQDEQKVVRVGWFDSSFCYYDSFGRRCGIDYEYHQKISAYTGWTYEYVEDSWSNLLQMLKDGDIDLLCDVSYKPEREEFMYFSDLPMGTEAYYIYTNSDNSEITADNLSSFNGKKIGVNPMATIMMATLKPTEIHAMVLLIRLQRSPPVASFVAMNRSALI